MSHLCCRSTAVPTGCTPTTDCVRTQKRANPFGRISTASELSKHSGNSDDDKGDEKGKMMQLMMMMEMMMLSMMMEKMMMI